MQKRDFFNYFLFCVYFRNDYQKSQKELEELKKVLDAKEEIETKNIEAFKKLEKTAIALEKELSNAKSSLEDSEEKVKSLDNTLQNTFRFKIK